MNIQHSSRSDSWRTPPEVIAMVKEVLGSIDLDPASSVHANETVGASQFFTEQDDALSKREWPAGSVFLNPPGGKLKNRSKTQLFWSELMRHRAAGSLTHAIFLAFSAEALQNTQRKGVEPIMAFPICVPSKRIRFLGPTGEEDAPSHSNVIAYVPGTVNLTPKFAEVFSSLGWVKT